MKVNFWILLLIIFYSCGDNNVYSVIDTLPKQDSTDVCNLENVEAYRVAYTTWKDSSSIRYFIEYIPIISQDGTKIVDYFNRADKKYISDITKKVSEESGKIIEKKIYEVYNKEEANVIFKFKIFEDDGVGGNLALSSFPPTKNQYGKPTISFDLADMYKYVKERDKAAHTYERVFRHEATHLYFGLFHDIENGVSNPSKKYNSYQFDDISGAKVNYKLFNDFIYNGVTYTFITKDNNKNITNNFKVSEFYTKCTAPKYSIGHFISKNCINGLQLIRDKYNTPIRVTSTFRNKTCNTIAGGASESQHMHNNAIDWKFIGVKAGKSQLAYEKDVMSRSTFLQKLLLSGIMGYGSYPGNFNHIDSRVISSGNRSLNGYKYIVWGEFAGSNAYYSPELEFKLHD